MAQPTYEELLKHIDHAENELIEAGISEKELRYLHGQFLSSAAELADERLAGWWEEVQASIPVEQRDIVFPMLVTLHAFKRDSPMLYDLLSLQFSLKMQQKNNDEGLSSPLNLDKLLFDA